LIVRRVNRRFEEGLMRKLLLASVAVLGAWGAVAPDASAQQVISPTYMGPGNPPSPSPQPGQVVVRLNGRFRFYAAGVWDQDNNNNTAGSASGNSNAAGLGTLTGGNKLATYTFGEYARLYPGFDGIAANGLKYGASLEIRQDQNSGAGGGAFGGISQQSRARGGLYFRREWGYLRTDQIGTFRFGSIDQPSSLYMTGNFENFNDGGWNGDVPGMISNGPTWPFADVGNYYTTSKIVYLSPQFFGVDGGVSYEPNTGNVGGVNTNGCGGGGPVGSSFVSGIGGGVAAPGCDRLSSSPNNAESGRRRNTFDVLLRYRGSFGPVGVAATGGYIGGGNVQDNSGLPFNNNPLTTVTNINGTTTGIRSQFEGLSVGDFGAQVTVAGFSFGGKYQFGRFNNQWSLLPSGLPDSQAWLVGGSYTIGPVIVGAHYFNYLNSGDLANAALGRRRLEQGFAAGGTYSIAPGVSLFLSYLWGERRQNGFNFVTGQGVTTTSPQGNPYNNKVQSQLLSLGTAFSW